MQFFRKTIWKFISGPLKEVDKEFHVCFSTKFWDLWVLVHLALNSKPNAWNIRENQLGLVELNWIDFNCALQKQTGKKHKYLVILLLQNEPFKYIKQLSWFHKNLFLAGHWPHVSRLHAIGSSSPDVVLCARAMHGTTLC